MTQYEKLVVSAYTGVLMANMEEFQNFAEQTLGRPVQTIEFADRLIWESLKEKLQPEFLKICQDEAVEQRETTPAVNTAKAVYYIKNTVDEYNSCIMGYFSTLETGQEALKDCEDWYRSKGTGEIYQVDMDTLNPDPVLVCKDGTLIDKEFKIQTELYELMKPPFLRFAEKIYDPDTPLAFFYSYLHEKEPNCELMNFLHKFNIELDGNDFLECFDNVRTEYAADKDRLVPTFNLNALVVDDKGRRGRVVGFEPQNKIYRVLFVDPENISEDGWYRPERLKPYNTKDIYVGAVIIDDDGYKGKVTAYNSKVNMYKVEHELENDRLPVADCWYRPERLKLYERREKGSDKKGLDILINQAKGISEQAQQLSHDLQKHKENLDLDH